VLLRAGSLLDIITIAKILKPVVDVIGALEFASSTLGDVWIQTLKLYRTLKSLSLSSMYIHMFRV
jgi:hypothetical protein